MSSEKVTLPMASLKAMVSVLPGPAKDELLVKLIVDAAKDPEPGPPVEVRGTCSTCSKWSGMGSMDPKKGICSQVVASTIHPPDEEVRARGMVIGVTSAAAAGPKLYTASTFGCAMWSEHAKRVDPLLATPYRGPSRFA